MIKLNVLQDERGRDVQGLAISDTVNSLSLSASAAGTFTVPGNANYVYFSGTTNYYISFGNTATIPGTTTDGSSAVLNPGFRGGIRGKTITAIAPAAVVITAEFWQ